MKKLTINSSIPSSSIVSLRLKESIADLCIKSALKFSVANIDPKEVKKIVIYPDSISFWDENVPDDMFYGSSCSMIFRKNSRMTNLMESLGVDQVKISPKDFFETRKGTTSFQVR